MIELHPEDLKRLKDAMGEELVPDVDSETSQTAPIAGCCKRCIGRCKINTNLSEDEGESPEIWSDCPDCNGSGRNLITLSAYQLEKQREGEWEIHEKGVNGLSGFVHMHIPSTGEVALFDLPLPLGRHIIAEEWIEWWYDDDGNDISEPKLFLVVNTPSSPNVVVFKQTPSTMPESLACYVLTMVDVGEVIQAPDLAGPLFGIEGWHQVNARAYLERINNETKS